jgi:hypothetical protein
VHGDCDGRIGYREVCMRGARTNGQRWKRKEKRDSWGLGDPG